LIRRWRAMVVAEQTVGSSEDRARRHSVSSLLTSTSSALIRAFWHSINLSFISRMVFHNPSVENISSADKTLTTIWTASTSLNVRARICPS